MIRILASIISKKVFNLTILLGVPLVLISQSVQEEYLEAKRLFNTGQYLSAKATFSNLARSNTPFASYASFYYGLSAWESGDADIAIDSWNRLLEQYPDFDQKGEVLYWLSFAEFSTGDMVQGINYAKRHAEEVRDTTAETELTSTFIARVSMDSLKQLIDIFPQFDLLAETYVKRSLDLPYNERDFVYIDSLRSTHDIDIARITDVSLPIIKKDSYRIAAMLPFMYESLENPGRILQNSLVTDLYQGMELAVEDLRKEGINIDLIPYDTKRSKAETASILESKNFKNTDLIIGPLYSDPVQSAQDYSLAHQMNMINPISSTSEIIGRNPFSFLFKPSTETMALALADLAIAEMDSNKNAMIFYEQGNEKDSLLASIYSEKLEAAGFNIVWNTAINQDNAKAIQDSLTAEHDVYLTKYQADSIRRIPDRMVESRRVRDDELKRIYAEQGKENAFTLPVTWEDSKAMVYYEEVLDMAKDSIGHFLVATHKSVFSNNLISVVQARKDSTRIYTYADWLGYTMADYNQFERLGITMADPSFIDKERFSFQETSDRLALRYKTIPSEYHYTGYELIWFVGRQMNAYGKYFQNGLREGRFTKGKIFEGVEYGLANDNQVVPIIRFRDTKLEVVNRNSYGY